MNPRSARGFITSIARSSIRYCQAACFVSLTGATRAANLAGSAPERLSSHFCCIERVTSMRTIVGNEINEPDLQAGIARATKGAHLVIADISAASDGTFNVDCCIEAGMANIYDVDVALVAKGKPRSPPFMLRRAGQLSTYSNDVEQLGVIQRIVRQYRRRVLNAEF
jgi:hypothetical protein